jgi:hypothetical protein
MSRNETTTRTGAHVDGTRASGCTACGHPFTLHSNGRTPCKAAACAAGPPETCPFCEGTRVSSLTDGSCPRCHGEGTVPTPCTGFASEHQVQELLAS